ncbi:MAG: hypothetical protein KGL39_19310 [Patescibacteria group bacterium]|nr:hypothetical protein [Patescibacteria group bacterium]
MSTLINKQKSAINLALTGRLEDDIPDCMSNVIGKWIIPMQDSISSEMRNSARWKSLLVRAAGTGRQHELERLAIVMDWMWGTVLPQLQPMADEHGFGDAWRRMTAGRTEADAARAAWAARVADAAWVTASRSDAAAAWAAAEWADAARAAADAARAAADAEGFWASVDPCGLLERLIEVSEVRGSTEARA